MRQGLGGKYERLLRLEERALEEGIAHPRADHAGGEVENANPCYRERHVESSRPGELLCQDAYLVGVFKSVGKVYLHSVVDTYGSYGLGFLYAGREIERQVGCWAVAGIMCSPVRRHCNPVMTVYIYSELRRGLRGRGWRAWRMLTVAGPEVAWRG